MQLCERSPKTPETRSDYGIIRVFIGHHQSANFVRLRYPSSYQVSGLADWVTILVEHLPEETETGGSDHCIGPDCAGGGGGCKCTIARCYILVNYSQSQVGIKLGVYRAR